MKLRATMVIDLEVPDDAALEKYGSTDPYAVAAALQRDIPSELERDDDARLVSASIVPLHG